MVLGLATATRDPPHRAFPCKAKVPSATMYLGPTSTCSPTQVLPSTWPHSPGQLLNPRKSGSLSVWPQRGGPPGGCCDAALGVSTRPGGWIHRDSALSGFSKASGIPRKGCRWLWDLEEHWSQMRYIIPHRGPLAKSRSRKDEGSQMLSWRSRPLSRAAAPDLGCL